MTELNAGKLINENKDNFTKIKIAAAIGLVLGVIIAVIKVFAKENKYLKIPGIICDVYTTIIRGTPAMVQLLIIYYVIFSSTNVSKILVAVITFGLNSSAYVAEIFRAGILDQECNGPSAANLEPVPHSIRIRIITVPLSCLVILIIAVVSCILVHGFIELSKRIIRQSLHLFGFVGSIRMLQLTCLLLIDLTVLDYKLTPNDRVIEANDPATRKAHTVAGTVFVTGLYIALLVAELVTVFTLTAIGVHQLIYELEDLPGEGVQLST